MAGQEEQEQGVVGLFGRAGLRFVVEPLLPPPPGHLGPHDVEVLARGDGHEPALRLVRQAVLRPPPERLDQRLLHGVLGRREVVSAADEDTEHLRTELLEQAVQLGGAGCALTLTR